MRLVGSAVSHNDPLPSRGATRRWRQVVSQDWEINSPATRRERSTTQNGLVLRSPGGEPAEVCDGLRSQRDGELVD